jgi:hypothetical protein
VAPAEKAAAVPVCEGDSVAEGEGLAVLVGLCEGLSDAALVRVGLPDAALVPEGVAVGGPEGEGDGASQDTKTIAPPAPAVLPMAPGITSGVPETVARELFTQEEPPPPPPPPPLPAS